MWDVVVDYLGSIQVIHKGVAKMLSVCKWLVVGDPDFNCSARMSKESDELGGLVVGNAVMKELNQPQRNK